MSIISLESRVCPLTFAAPFRSAEVSHVKVAFFEADGLYILTPTYDKRSFWFGVQFNFTQ